MTSNFLLDSPLMLLVGIWQGVWKSFLFRWSVKLWGKLYPYSLSQHVHKGPLSLRRKGSPINLWCSPELLSLSLILTSPPSFISIIVISIVNLGSKAANCHLPIHQLIGCRGEREVGKKGKDTVLPSYLATCSPWVSGKCNQKAWWHWGDTFPKLHS